MASEKGIKKIHLDATRPIPLYRQLANSIRDAIERGEYEHDDQIPTESELIELYEVSRITVRKALEELTEEGLLVREQGKGTFVSTKQSIQLNYPFMPFDEAVRQAGKEPETKLLSYSTVLPSKRISSFLGIGEQEPVICIRRARYANGEPVMLEKDYYPMSFDFFASEPLNGSTSEILRKHDIYPIHGVNTVNICFATEEEAVLLNVEPDTPLLYLYSEIKDQNTNPTQVSKQIIRPSLYQLTLTT